MARGTRHPRSPPSGRGRGGNCGGREDERGQTLYDYALGISLFVLTIAATVSLLPSLLPASQPGPTGALSATSDRIAQEVVTNETTAVPGEATGLDADGMKQLATLSESQLRDRFAIRTTWQVNLTVESLDGSRVVTDAGGTPLTAGSTYDGDSGAEEIRIVTVNNDTYAGCTPACRLVVRVW